MAKSGWICAACAFIASTMARVCIMSPPLTMRSGRAGVSVAGIVRNRHVADSISFADFSSVGAAGAGPIPNSYIVSGCRPVSSVQRRWSADGSTTARDAFAAAHVESPTLRQCTDDGLSA